MRYSGFRVIKEALTGHKGWTPAWRNPEPQGAYDIIIIGGGGHGLATAYYLAKQFGEKKIAVLEKGWIGGGNVGRNTTIIRSNYLLDGNEPFYELSLKLWEGLEQDFNYNAMISQRGILNLIHNDAQRDAFTRRGNAMILNGADAVMLSTEQIKAEYPFLNVDDARFPIKGGLAQRRGGTVRHDAVAWGYARGADSRGVDIIQNCEVTEFRIEDGACLGVETSRGFIGAKKVGAAVAGSSGRLMAKAGMRLPIESHVLQAFVSEGLKPLLPGVITFGAGHFYCSQSDKGGLVFGGDIDGYNSYAQRGNRPWLRTFAKAAWRSCLQSAGRVCFGCGVALWICRWMARQLLIKHISMGSILMAAGAMVALKPPLLRDCALPICWPPAHRMRSLPPISLIASAVAK